MWKYCFFDFFCKFCRIIGSFWTHFVSNTSGNISRTSCSISFILILIINFQFFHNWLHHLVYFFNIIPRNSQHFKTLTSCNMNISISISVSYLCNHFHYFPSNCSSWHSHTQCGFRSVLCYPECIFGNSFSIYIHAHYFYLFFCFFLKFIS